MKKQCTKRTKGAAHDTGKARQGRSSSTGRATRVLPLQLKEKSAVTTTMSTTTTTTMATTRLPPPLLRELSLPFLCYGEWGGDRRRGSVALLPVYPSGISWLCCRRRCRCCFVYGCAALGSKRVGIACHFYGRDSFMAQL